METNDIATQIERTRRAWGRWAAGLLRVAPLGDLTIREVAVLGALHEERSADELGVFLGWPASEVVRDARRLAAVGLVVCEGDDGPALRLRPSERGAGLATALVQLRARATEDLVATLKPEERTVIRDAMRLFAEASERMGRVPEPA